MNYKVCCCEICHFKKYCGFGSASFQPSGSASIWIREDNVLKKKQGWGAARRRMFWPLVAGTDLLM